MPFSLLETTAEVAVAFAGFIGIFLVLATQSGRFPAADGMSIRVMVAAGVASVFYAVAPILLHGLGIAGTALWRTSSAIGGFAGLATTVYFLRVRRRVPREEWPEPTEARVLVAWSLTIVALVAHLGNAAAWPWQPSGGVYALGVWAVLGLAASIFVSLLFRRVL